MQEIFWGRGKKGRELEESGRAVRLLPVKEQQKKGRKEGREIGRMFDTLAALRPFCWVDGNFRSPGCLSEDPHLAGVGLCSCPCCTESLMGWEELVEVLLPCEQAGGTCQLDSLLQEA